MSFRRLACAALLSGLSSTPALAGAPDAGAKKPLGDVIASPEIDGGATRVGDTIIAGQPSAKGFAELKRRGAKSVVNLRATTEPGASTEKKAVEALGLGYAQAPVVKTALDAKSVDAALAAIDAAAKPVVLHCAGGNRAAAIWAIHQTTRGGVPVEEALEAARTLGLKPELEDFVKRESAARTKK